VIGTSVIPSTDDGLTLFAIEAVVDVLAREPAACLVEVLHPANTRVNTIKPDLHDGTRTSYFCGPLNGRSPSGSLDVDDRPIREAPGICKIKPQRANAQGAHAMQVAD
jgi:hypothetical protein